MDEESRRESEKRFSGLYNIDFIQGICLALFVYKIGSSGRDGNSVFWERLCKMIYWAKTDDWKLRGFPERFVRQQVQSWMAQIV